MKKKLAVTVLTAAMTVAMGLTAFAGVGWIQEPDGRWWYSTAEDNSSWWADGAVWLDGNKDGIAEEYYFDSEGWMVQDTYIEGYYFNNEGQWEVDGKVQTQPSEYQLTGPNGSYYGDISDRWQWADVDYYTEAGDYLRLGIGENDGFAAIYIPVSTGAKSAYTMEKVSDGNYKSTKKNKTMTLNSDGTITFSGKVFYAD